jgi:putative heme-binding domain-containing protein
MRVGNAGQRPKFVPVLWHAFFAIMISSMPIAITRAAAQEKTAQRPTNHDAGAVQEGRSIFRTDCSLCHGMDARGAAKGPDLTTGRWTHGSSDREIFETITNGVPGTEMPANDLSEAEAGAVIAFLRKSAANSGERAVGSAENGERTFFGKGYCVRCHMVDGKGGRLGPDLSRSGVARSARYLSDSIRFPDKDLAEGTTDPNSGFPSVYDTVTVVTKGGQHFTGVAKNEDPFSLQLMDQGEQLRFFLKQDLKEVTHEPKSLMPAYDERMLSEQELHDLVAYLAGLRR